LASWSPPEPTSALPAGSIFNQPAETVNPNLRKVAPFSTGRMGHFQPVLTGPHRIQGRIISVRHIPGRALVHRAVASAGGTPNSRSRSVFPPPVRSNLFQSQIAKINLSAFSISSLRAIPETPQGRFPNLACYFLNRKS